MLDDRCYSSTSHHLQHVCKASQHLIWRKHGIIQNHQLQQNPTWFIDSIQINHDYPKWKEVQNLLGTMSFLGLKFKHF